ncbi:hypothetical protein HNQ56_001497 [Anaerotaenia torta]
MVQAMLILAKSKTAQEQIAAQSGEGEVTRQFFKSS